MNILFLKIGNPSHWFPHEMSFEKLAQKFHTDDESLPGKQILSG